MSRYAAASVSDPGAGDDLAQSTMIALLERGRLDDISSLDGYAFGILKNGIKAFRRVNAESLCVPSVHCDAAHEPALPDIAEDYVSRERAREIQALIRDCLDPTESRYFALRFSGLKPREIAKHETDAGHPTTAEAVRWSLSNSRAKIRRRLEPCGVMIHYAWDKMARRLRSSLSGIKRSLTPGDMVQNLSRSVPNICQSIVEISVAMSAFLSPAAVEALSEEPPLESRVAALESSAETLTPSQVGLVLDPVYDLDDPALHRPKESFSPSTPTKTSQAADQTPTFLPGQNSSSRKDGSIPVDGNAPTGIPGITEDGEFKIRDPAGGEATLSRRSERSSEPAPPLANQTLDLVENPEKIPLPECGGLPPCEQLPKRLEI